MKLVETLKSRTKALKVQEVAELLEVTPQHIYKATSPRSLLSVAPPALHNTASVRALTTAAETVRA